ncbi:MAG TPA: hypothetical protein VNI20_06995 [Fimbriimonadaceae bacterium]|nr:hypothetical protein [Fimbriimonadaceae bacterium]
MAHGLSSPCFSANKKDLKTWIAGGAPKGDPKSAPAPIKYDPTWTIGRPDAVFEIPKPVEVQSSGQMPYIYLRIPTDFGEDKWEQAMEILPTERAVVHHVLVFVVDGGKVNGKRLENLDATTGFFMGYVPGTSSVVFPKGEAKRLPKGATLLFQLHYTPNGRAVTDRTRIALKFTSAPPQHVVQVYGIANTTFKIPPGDPNFSDTRTITVPQDVMLTAFMPHMHLRGKAMRYDVEYPDGKKETLLNVPHYDFNWQLTYRYTKPKFIPKGSKITLTGTFDNSTDNPYNPDPTRTVPWGLQTTDEMMLGYIEFFVPGAAPGENLDIGS